MSKAYFNPEFPLLTSQPYANPRFNVWNRKAAERGIALIGSNVSHGGVSLNGRYKGQIVSQHAKNQDEALKGLFAQADKIDG